MKLSRIIKRRKHAGKWNSGRRFYTSTDMSIIKHDEAVKNSRIKRGEEKKRGNNNIIVCGCGAEGCFIHNGWDNPKKYSWGDGPFENYHNSGNKDKVV